MSYDPDVIHSCHRCGRSYAVRPVDDMNHWHFYNVYCSAWCSMPTDRQELNGYVPAGDDSVFVFLLDRARKLYKRLRLDGAANVYWYGWEYSDAHPYRFASEFMDRVERSLFLSKHEREQFARMLFALTNDLHQGASS